MRAIVLVVALGACDAYDRDLGPAPFLCGPTEPRCPMGYTCMTDGVSGDEICIGKGGGVSGGLDCADDSKYEPNDALGTATHTTIDMIKSFTLDGLAVCPANDKDVFAISLAATETVEVLVTFAPMNAPLKGAIVNEGGVPIATSSGAGTPGTVRAMQANLPAGPYFVVVDGPNTGANAVNNYKLTINAN